MAKLLLIWRKFSKENSLPHREKIQVPVSQGEHDRASEDVHKAKSLGDPVSPEFLKILRDTTGRRKEVLPLCLLPLIVKGSLRNHEGIKGIL